MAGHAKHRAAGDAAVANQFFGNGARRINGNRKAKSFITADADFCGIDTNHLSGLIEQWAARVSGIDGCVSLEQIHNGIVDQHIAVYTGNDTEGCCSLQIACGITDRDCRLPHLNLVGIAKGGGVAAIEGLDYMDMLFFNIGGSAGELSALALIAGFIYLLARRVIRPYITLSILATVAVFSGIFWAINPAEYTDPLFNILTGGLLLGSIFMATDYVTSPMSNLGGVVFGIGIGLITMLIRYFGAYPEGVSFAILIMNSVVPLINKWCHAKKYGR